MLDRTRLCSLTRLVTLVLCAGLVAMMLVGCLGEDAGSVAPKEEPAAEKPKVEKETGGNDAPAPGGLTDAESTIHLTFTGTPSTPGNFAMPNSTPVKEKGGRYYANASADFVPAQTDGGGTDTWVFDAKLGPDDTLTGTATATRSMHWTGHNGVQTWSGTVTGKLDKDLRLIGTVTGTESYKNDGTTIGHPVSWSFTEK
jgi:hypothetical protein